MKPQGLYRMWTTAELAAMLQDDPTIIAYRLRKLGRAGFVRSRRSDGRWMLREAAMRRSTVQQ